MERTNNFNSLNWVSATFYNKEESKDLNNLILMNQIHGTTIEVITETPSTSPIADGLITQQKNLKLAVKTADCIPLLIADPLQKTIAAIHVGWKSGLEGIIESGLLSFMRLGSCPENLICALGPSLQKQSFPVSKEMMNLYPSSEHCFFEAREEGIFFDAPSYVVYRLKRGGVKNIEQIFINTYRDENYYSYRRSPSEKGRQYGVIELL